MKLQDIEIGKTYALGTRYDRLHFQCRRGVAVRVSTKRQRGSGYYSGRDVKAVTFQVKFADGATREVTEFSVNVHDWEEYATARREHIQSKRSAQEGAYRSKVAEYVALKRVDDALRFIQPDRKVTQRRIDSLEAAEEAGWEVGVDKSLGFEVPVIDVVLSGGLNTKISPHDVLTLADHINAQSLLR